MADTLKTPLPRYHAEFGRSVYVWGTPKIGECWGHGGMPYNYKHAVPHVGYHAESDRCWSKSRPCTEIRLKILTARIPPFKVTQDQRI